MCYVYLMWCLSADEVESMEPEPGISTKSLNFAMQRPKVYFTHHNYHNRTSECD
jgi:hypothetical protein